MKYFGLSPDDYSEVHVFPDNVQAHNLFVTMGTQWRVGPAGPYGLDYLVLYQKMDRMGLSSERYEALEAEIRIMEDAALEEMRKD
jgi:hypothetical protein